MSRRIGLWAALLGLIVGACSSTAERRSDAGGVTVVAPTEAAGARQPAGGGLPGAPPRASAAAPGTEVAPAAGGERPQRTTAKGGAGKSLPGIDAKTIRIGFWWMNATAACGAVAIDPSSREGICSAGEEKEIKGIVKWVNDHGGMAGRKVIPVIYSTDYVNTPYAAQAEAACRYFTEDEEVLMVVSEGQVGRPVMAHCLAEHGIPFIEPGWYPFDAVEYRNLAGFIYQPHRVRPERWIAAYIDGLHDQGFFAKGTKIGLFRFDEAPYTRVTEGVLKPRLARYGLKLTVESVIRKPPSFSGYSDMSAELGAEILRMKRANVNRVIFFSGVGELETFYFPQAESQDFRPRYGLTSMSWPDLMAGIAPREQLQGAIGIGWSPFYDVQPRNDPGGTAASRACRDALAAAGTPSSAGRNNKCDSVFFIKAILDRARSFSVPGLKAAVEGMGNAYVPAVSFSTRFGPGRYDGPSSLRYLAFDAGQRTFLYRGSLRPLP